MGSLWEGEAGLGRGCRGRVPSGDMRRRRRPCRAFGLGARASARERPGPSQDGVINSKPRPPACARRPIRRRQGSSYARKRHDDGIRSSTVAGSGGTCSSQLRREETAVTLRRTAVGCTPGAHTVDTEAVCAKIEAACRQTPPLCQRPSGRLRTKVRSLRRMQRYRGPPCRQESGFERGRRECSLLRSRPLLRWPSAASSYVFLRTILMFA